MKKQATRRRAPAAHGLGTASLLGLWKIQLDSLRKKESYYGSPMSMIHRFFLLQNKAVIQFVVEISDLLRLKGLQLGRA